MVVVVVGQSKCKTKSKRSNGRVFWGWMDDCFAVFVAVVIVPTLNNCTPMTANINCSRHVTRTIFPMVFTATITHWTTCCMRNKYEGPFQMTPDSVIVVVGVLIGRGVDFVLSYQSDICELIK